MRKVWKVDAMRPEKSWSGELLRWAALQQDSAAPQPASRWLDEAGRMHRVVATDASINPGRRGAGIAVVSFEGIVWQEHLPTSWDITSAELTAIRRALEHTLDSEPLLIVSDSQAAVDYATTARIPHRPDLLGVTTTIRNLMSRRTVRIQWVKGHNGHVLNESADRAAKTARRTPQEQNRTRASLQCRHAPRF